MLGWLCPNGNHVILLCNCFISRDIDRQVGFCGLAQSDAQPQSSLWLFIETTVEERDYNIFSAISISLLMQQVAQLIVFLTRNPHILGLIPLGSLGFSEVFDDQWATYFENQAKKKYDHLVTHNNLFSHLSHQTGRLNMTCSYRYSTYSIFTFSIFHRIWQWNGRT